MTEYLKKVCKPTLLKLREGVSAAAFVERRDGGDGEGYRAMMSMLQDIDIELHHIAEMNQDTDRNLNPLHNHPQREREIPTE